MKRFSPLLLCLLAGLCLLAQAALWWMTTRPVALDPEWDGLLESVSFAPFRKGQSPLDGLFPTVAELEEDVALIATTARGVRTYTSREGMENLPDLARRYGVKITHSAWLGRNPDTNALELDALIETANAHPDVIERVIVGNEVLLRRDLKPAELKEALDRVRRGIAQPVSYADVWAFWLQNPSLADHVDFITIHILPYWEDEPLAVGALDRHVGFILGMVRKAFPDKPILIGEVGWPTEGHSRGPASPSTLNAARLVRSLPAIAEKHGVSYNVVEMFDQIWKSRLEGTVGARWGLFDAERVRKFPLTGAVVPLPRWRTFMAVSLGLGALLSFAFLWRTPSSARRGDVVLYTVFLNVMGAALAGTALSLLGTSFTPGWLAWGWARVVLAAVCTVVVCWIACPWTICPGPERRPVGTGFLLYQVYAAFAVIKGLLFAWDGRYRDLPDSDFLVPVAGLFMLAVMRMMRGEAGLGLSLLTTGVPAWPLWRYRARRFFWLLMVTAVFSLATEPLALSRGQDFLALHPDWSERWPLLLASVGSNASVLWWSAMLVLLAVPFGVDGYGGRRGVEAAPLRKGV